MTNERKTMMAALAAAALLGAAAAGVAGAQDGSRGAAAGNATRGKQLYYAHGCYGCHGYTGETGAQMLVGPKAPIVSNVDTFLTFLRLRADYAPTVPAERMPNYSKAALSDADARDIYAYIRTFKVDAPAIAAVPTFQSILKGAEKEKR